MFMTVMELIPSFMMVVFMFMTQRRPKRIKIQDVPLDDEGVSHDSGSINSNPGLIQVTLDYRIQS